MALSAFVRLSRPVTLPAPVAGVIGGALAATGGGVPYPGKLLAAVASAVCLTAASNAINQIADLETDRINRPDRPIPAGHLSVRAAWVFTALQSVAAFALAALVNLPYFACVAITLPVTASYSLRPLRFKRLPFVAGAVIATPRGLLLVLAGWAAGGGIWRQDAWILGAVAFLYVFGASTTKDFADVEGDRATGCVTLPILWGAGRAARFVAPFLVIPFLVYPLAAAAGWLSGGLAAWSILGLLLAGLGAAAARLLLRDPMGPADGSPHPAWGLMYLQLTATHAGAAVVLSLAA
ncbi:MAG: UbiA family prenyltransferase [Planctomycetaceae bacterium]